MTIFDLKKKKMGSEILKTNKTRGKQKKMCLNCTVLVARKKIKPLKLNFHRKKCKISNKIENLTSKQKKSSSSSSLNKNRYTFVYFYALLVFNNFIIFFSIIIFHPFIKKFQSSKSTFYQ